MVKNFSDDRKKQMDCVTSYPNILKNSTLLKLFFKVFAGWTDKIIGSFYQHKT